MKKIFVASDFSDVSFNAVKYACGLAQQFKAAVHIIHVYESPLFYTAEMPYTAIEAAENLAKSDSTEKMDNLRSTLTAAYPELNFEYHVKRGISADAITEEAAANGADMLITGSTGTGVIERRLIGTTTTAIINKARCPVLIVPEEASYNGIKSLVYTTDLNDENIKAVNTLIPFATALNAELVFLFVDNKIHTDSDKISEEMAEKIRSQVTYPKTSGYVCTDGDVMNGISTFLKNSKADMVAMLTHHRSFPKMLWDSSITKKFSYHPDVPLLVIHAEVKE
jgi:nucleotide-binding universal stress UspA family protein